MKIGAQLKVAVIFATSLLLERETLTSLELKEALREAYPLRSWTQEDVSELLKHLASSYSDIRVEDNGTFLTYSLPTYEEEKEKNEEKYVGPFLPESLVKNAIDTAKGTFFKACFSKKNDVMRNISCQFKDYDENGYIRVRLNNSKDYKLISPSRVISLIIKGVQYNVDSE